MSLRQKRLERLEGEEDRLVQRFVQARAGQGAGFLIPLGHVELFVEGDQRRRHGVDNAVEVVLEAGELFLDLAAHLDFQFQLAVGVAGFFGQALGLIVSGLGVIAGALELLLTGFDARQHGVEGFGQAADFVVVAARGTQGIVLFTGDLAGQLFEFMDGPGDQAFDLPCDDQPQQHTENQNAQAGCQRAGVERHRQLTAGHQQQMPGGWPGRGRVITWLLRNSVRLPGFDVPVALRQVQSGRHAASVPVASPFAVVQRSGTQR